MFSESLSRTTSSVFSDDSVPVLGRRAQRLQQLSNSGSVFTLSQSNLSDSDRSDYDTTVGLISKYTLHVVVFSLMFMACLFGCRGALTQARSLMAVEDS